MILESVGLWVLPYLIIVKTSSQITDIIVTQWSLCELDGSELDKRYCLWVGSN